MTFNGTPRPRPRWYHAETELDDFAIVSYRVPTGAVARLLPAGFAPLEFTYADGGTAALVSAVAFRDRDFHFRFCPPLAIIRRLRKARPDHAGGGAPFDTGPAAAALRHPHPAPPVRSPASGMRAAGPRGRSTPGAAPRHRRARHAGEGPHKAGILRELWIIGNRR
ncbi:DUF2071 domain-containing protein [Streptosporangium canum]|uniref:DUF2071 domain-containing protein n=1 Tax=Streptosporangium canum TaxID=324952 RepID=UPI00369BE9D5